VFARPVLRLEGPALALATFALAAALPPLLRHDALSPWTGGVQGIAIDRPAPPLPGLDGDQWLYLVVLAVAIALHVAAHNLVQGRMGRALVALRDHPSAAAAMGIDGARVRSLAFGVAGLCAGVAGGLSALVTGFVSPDGFTVLLSIQLLVGAVVGGLGSILGGVAGAIFLVVVPGLASDLSEGAPWAIEGAVTIAVALFLPRGVAGWVRAARARK
jgi:branched-chain amino acid transport system permease protein